MSNTTSTKKATTKTTNKETIEKLQKAIEIIRTLQAERKQFYRLAEALKADKKAQQHNEKNKNEKIVSFELLNSLKVDILTAFDCGQNQIELNPINLALYTNAIFLLLPSEKNNGQIIINSIDYDKNTIKFEVNLSKFTNKSIDYYNREYGLNLPTNTEKQPEYDMLESRCLDFLESVNI